MEKSEFEIKKKELWDKTEKRYGVRFPRTVRGRFEDIYFAVSHDYDADLEDMEKDINQQAELQSLMKPQVDTIEGNAYGKKLYRKCWEKRAYLIDFVVKTYLEDIDSVYDVYLKPPRFKWQKMTKKWNKLHPADITTWETFKVNFYRAKKAVPQVYFIAWEWLLFPYFWLVGSKEPESINTGKDIENHAFILLQIQSIRLDAWRGVPLTDDKKWYIGEIESINRELRSIYTGEKWPHLQEYLPSKGHYSDQIPQYVNEQRRLLFKISHEIARKVEEAQNERPHSKEG